MCFLCLEKMQQKNTDPAVSDDVFDLWKEREIFKTYHSSLDWERKDDIVYLFLKFHISKHKAILIAGWKKYLNSVTTS